MTTTTSMHTSQSDTFESIIGLALLWLVPAVAFIVALFLG